MKVEYINPFIESFSHVMNQIGFTKTENGALSVKDKYISCTGIVLVVGIIGDLKGNVVYVIDPSDAKKIASAMMMGKPINELDEISKSSLSELSNILSANAATHFSKTGVLIDITTPTLFHGEDIIVTMSSEKVLCVQLLADGIPVEVNISFNKM